jgi:hypothetical protein
MGGGGGGGYKHGEKPGDGACHDHPLGELDVLVF